MKRFASLGFALSIIALALACGLSPEARRQEIRSLQDAGQFTETLEPLRQLLEAAPDDPELNHLYGLALLRTDQAGLAMWPLRKAAQAPERAVSDGLLLAQALLLGGSSPEESVQAASRVVELAPDNVEALRLLTDARLSAMQNEELLADVERLLALAPGDVDALISRLMALLNLNRVEEAEQALAAVRAALEDRGEDLEWAPRLCAATATFTLEKGDAEAAAVLWDECVEQFPAEEMTVFGAVTFFDERWQGSHATEILRRAHEAQPTHLPFVEALASRLGASGQSDEAEQLLRAATQDGVNNQRAWFSLANYHERRDEPAKARDAMAQGLRLTSQVSDLQLAEYVDLLIRAGDYDKADEVIARMEAEPVVLNLLRGRLLLARGQPAEAVEALEAGLRLWPSHSVGRWLLARAFEQLGDYDRALAEYVEAVRADSGYRDAVFDLLRLLDALGRGREAIPVLSRYQVEKPRDPESLVQMIRIAGRAGQWELANRAIGELAQIPGQQSVVATEVADIRAARAGFAAAFESIQSANLDLTKPINGPALRALVGYLVGLGRPNEALQFVDAALAAHPEEPLFHELRARPLRATGDVAAARKALEGALALEPERASALAALAALTAEQGDRQAAIALYDRADRADPEEPAHAWDAIQLVAASDDDAELERRLEALLARHGTHAKAANLLAQRLRERDPERALLLAKRAVRFRGGPDALETLGRIQLQRGEAERAVQTLGRVAELRPDSPSTHYWLGLARSATGDEEGARQAFSTALESDAFPEREAARRELARLSAE